MKTAHAFRALVLVAAMALPAALPASAEDGFRKIGGEGYAIQISRLDLSRPADRQAVLQKIETAAHKFCVSHETPLVLRRACQKHIVSGTIANATPGVQKALQLAMSERKGIQYAAR